jgi:protein-disulfide isomerase
MPKTSNPLAQKKSVLSINVVLTLVVVVVAAVVFGGVLLFSGKGENSQLQGGVPADVLSKPDSHKLIEAPDGKVTIVEFFDFQCPSCGRYNQSVIPEIEKKYQGKINLVARNFPLDGHPLGIHAAQAAEAAGLQGKYKEMYDVLFKNWDAWAYSPEGAPNKDVAKARGQFEQYAQQVGVDLAKFRQDIDSPQVTDRIKRDQDDGSKAGVEGTPSFYINGKKFEAQGSNVQDIIGQFSGEIEKDLSK